MNGAMLASDGTVSANADVDGAALGAARSLPRSSSRPHREGLAMRWHDAVASFLAIAERPLRLPVAWAAGGVALLAALFLATPAEATSMSVRNIVIGMSEADVDRTLAGHGYRRTARTADSPVTASWVGTMPMVERDRIDIAYGPGGRVQVVRRVAQMARARQASLRSTWREALARTHGKPALLGQAVEGTSDFLYFRSPDSAPGCNGFPIAATSVDWALSLDVPFTGSGQPCRSGLGVHLVFEPGGQQRMRIAVWLLWSGEDAPASTLAAGGAAVSDPGEVPQVSWQAKFEPDIKMIGIATQKHMSFISMTLACAGPNRMLIAMEVDGGAAGPRQRALPLVVDGTRFALPARYFRAEGDGTGWLETEVGMDAPVVAALGRARTLADAAMGARGALPIDGFEVLFQSLEEHCQDSLPAGYVLLNNGDRDRCMETAGTTIAMIECSKREIARIEPALATTHAAAGRQGAAPSSLAQLREERLATCEAAAQAYAGGSMMGIERRTCLVRELRSQIAQLRREAGPVPAAAQSAPGAPGGSPEVEAARRAAAGPVTAFTEWIYSRFLQRGGGPPAFSALGTPEHVFDPELASAVRRIMLRGERAGGVYAISDPFMPGNDYDTATVNIRVIEETARTAKVAVSFRSFGKPVALVIDFVRGGQGWRVRDVVGEGYAFRSRTLADAR
jgi:uncharacterized protein YecT (DUF1311 family)